MEMKKMLIEASVLVKAVIFFSIMIFSGTYGVRSASASTAGSDVAWQQLNGEINVCWENFDDRYSTEAGWVKNSIFETWQKYGNVKFVGWGPCRSESRGVRIKIDDSNPLVRELGRKLDGMKNGMVLNFDFVKWGNSSCTSRREDCVRNHAVHEFGHALGLAHEHNTAGPEVCRSENQGSSGDWPLTIYDPDSIMNYCRSGSTLGGWNLSRGDVDGIKTIYPKYIPADIPDGRNGQLITQQSAQCLHVQGADGQRRRLLMQWPCQRTAEFYFSFHKLGPGEYQLRSPYSGNCFHYSTNGNELRAPLMQWECAETEEFRFKIDSAGTDSWGQEWFRIRGSRKGSEACFHVLEGPTKEPRKPMAAWTCLNGPEYLFTIK
ncbi:hypothetical protein GJ700_08090 [Duganella sp. FT92W]|uniref:Ricin B lectin domain-containing protein n=1 Tax=Pseudoduganella rivuli TaxID=2666085 RepID=A0A7X2LQS8_9BURK|nr:hypothetical protein [Pseudoduganella rivuli]MRV71685.1 hypothetical protein [Pseudoduganella rivuli]